MRQRAVSCRSPESRIGNSTERELPAIPWSRLPSKLKMTTTEAITSATFRRNLFPEGGVCHVALTHSSSDGELDKIGIQDSVFKHHPATASHSNEERSDNDDAWQTRTSQLQGRRDASNVASTRNDVDTWNEWCLESSSSGKKNIETSLVGFRSMESLLLPDLQMDDKKATSSWSSMSALSSMRYHVRDRELCKGEPGMDSSKHFERFENFSSIRGLSSKADLVTRPDASTAVSAVKLISEQGTKKSRWSAPESPIASRDAALGSENSPNSETTVPTKNEHASMGMEGGATTFEFLSQMIDLPEGFADAAAPGDSISFIAFPRSPSGGVQGFRMDSELAAELASAAGAAGAPGAVPGEEDSARLFSGEQSISWSEQRSRGMFSLQSGAILHRPDGSTVVLMPPKLQLSPPLQRTKSILLVKSSAAGVEERRERSERAGKSVRWRDSHGQLLASIREFDSSVPSFSEYDYDLDDDENICCGCCTIS